jgi:hypothetical protein
MTTETLKKEQSEAKETREITFKCQYCGNDKPLEDMRRIDRFIPPLIACRECEKKLR